MNAKKKSFWSEAMAWVATCIVAVILTIMVAITEVCVQIKSVVRFFLRK